MRGFLIVIAVVTAAVLAGCGSSSSGSASNPVTSELSYFPAGSPFVLSVATDPSSPAVQNAQALSHKFPLAAYGETALMGRLDQLGVDYQSQIRPLFGNPLMVGALTGTLGGSETQNYLVVWITKSSSDLSTLIKKAFPGAASSGSHDGATLYSNGGTTAAVDGATLVVGPSTAVVDAALDRHAHNQGIPQSTYSRLLSGLPQNGLVQMFGDLSSALAQPSAATARRIPWVAALRGYGVSISATATGLTFSYHLDTTGAQLTAAQIPFATGTATPSLAGALPITAGIEDPAHIVQFAESAEAQASPAGYAKFQAREATIRARTGVDLSNLITLMTGDLVINSDGHATLGRVQVSDPAKASSVLAKLVTEPQLVFTKATHVSSLGGGFYAIAEPGQTVTLGVSGNELVVGKATPARLRAFAAAPGTPTAGAQGSVAFRIALTQLLPMVLKGQVPQVAQSIVSALGDVTGWSASTPSGITGSATLAIH